MNPAIFGEQIINGLVSGSIYALMGGALAIVYGTMRVMNFAHGEFFMLGGYALYLSLAYFGLPPLLSVIFVILWVPFIAAIAQILLIKPLMERPGWELSTIVTTLGLSIVLQATALRTVGEEYYTLPYFVDGFITIGDLRLPLQRVLILGAAVVSIALMEIFLRKSRAGWALRATSQDAQAASVVGISTQTMFVLAFVLSGLLAAISSIVLSPIQSVNPWMGVPMGMKAFIVVILGGMGSFRGTIIAGFMLGVVEAVGVTVTSSEWREIYSFGLLILVLWFKPEGLFGNTHRRA